MKDLIRILTFIRLHLALFVALGIVGLAPDQAMAQGRDMGCSPTVANPCGGGSSRGGSTRGSPPRGGATYDPAEGRRSLAHEQNNQGLEAFNREDWAAAASYFEQALRNSPDDATIRKNLELAQRSLARQEEEREEKRERERAKAERQRQDKLAANNMQRSIQDFAKTLTVTPSAGGLDFDGSTKGKVPKGSNPGGLDFTAVEAMTRKARPTSHSGLGDPMVVDARVTRSGALLMERVPELKSSPAADRIIKGFQAVSNHDWPVALAWFQDALQADPENPTLKRSVDLAQWMVDRRKTAVRPVSPRGAASVSRDGNASAIRQLEGMERLSVGDEKGARQAFSDADQLQTPKSKSAGTPPQSKRQESSLDRAKRVQKESRERDPQTKEKLKRMPKHGDSVGGKPAVEEVILTGKG